MLKVKKVDFEPGYGTQIKLSLDGEYVIGSLESYREISSRNITDDDWYHFFGVVISFFESLEKEAAVEFFSFYKFSIEKISTIRDAGTAKTAIGEIGSALANLDRKIKLSSKIIAYEDLLYNEGVIQYPDLSHVGTRAHDSDDMTFYLPDYRALTCIRILSKMLIPVWGSIFRAMIPITDRTKVELSVIEIFDTILYNDQFGTIITKLDNYIGNTLKTHRTNKGKMIQDDTSIARLAKGFLPETENLAIRAGILLKKLCIFDTRHPKGDRRGDLVSYIHTAVGNTYDSLTSNFHGQNDLKVRFSPIGDGGDGQDQYSDMERSAMPSDMSADIPLLCEYRTVALLEMDSLFKELKLSKSYVAFIKKHLHIFNLQQFLIATVCRDIIKTGSTMKRLKLDTYLNLVFLTKARLERDGFHKLAVLMLSAVNENPSSVPATQSSILVRFEDYRAYTQICNRLTYRIGNMSLATTMRKLIMNLSRSAFTSIDKNTYGEAIAINIETLEDFYGLLIRELNRDKDAT